MLIVPCANAHIKHPIGEAREYVRIPAIGGYAMVRCPDGRILLDESGAPIHGSKESVDTLVSMLNSENG